VGGAEAVTALAAVQALILIIWFLVRFCSLNDVIYRNIAFVGLAEFAIVVLLFRLRIPAGLTLLGFRRCWATDLFFAVVFALPVLLSAMLALPSLLLAVKAVLIRWSIIDPSASLTYIIAKTQEAFASIFVGPLAEEAVYRGILYAPLRSRYGPRWAVLLTATLFAGQHISYLAAAFAGALMLAFVYEKTESFTAIVGLHGAWNILILIKEALFPL
jgi:membrane protease YdiL (CAAX protease family)